MLRKTVQSRWAFTLVELLVVVSIISLLVAFLLPALANARGQARSAVCGSNLRQVALAGIGYALEHGDHFVPGASDFGAANAGLHRWHGLRDNANSAFEALRGPLVSYLQDGAVKECPERVRFVKGGPWASNFEQGCGGYGYNMTYLGSRLWERGNSRDRAYARTTRSTELGNPAETVMFADTALARRSGGSVCYIEYSFAEPVFPLSNGVPYTSAYLSPSIHFRHHDRATVAWADSHVDQRARTPFGASNVYGISAAEVQLGWFGPLDNGLFDLE